MTPTPGQDENQGLVESTPEMEDQLFDGATSDEAPADPEPAPAEPEKAEPAVEGQPRGPDGKFATKEATPEAPQPAAAATEKPAGATEKEKDGWIPAWRVRQMQEEAIERGKSEAAELRRQLAALQKPADKPPEKPDPLIDPEGYDRYLEQKVEQRFRAERGDLSLRLARRDDPALFDKAYAAAADAIARGDRLTQARIYNSPDPGSELIAWHKEAETRREVGNDPAAYKQRVLEEALKDPAYLAKAIAAARGSASPNVSTSQPNGGARPAVRLPPTLSGVTRSSAALQSSDGEPNDDQLFDQLTG